MRGKFITFEGGEGCGKSTQVAVLAERLRSIGLNVVTTREPGGAPGAEQIRDLLVSGAVDRWTPMAEVLLNYAARETHVRETVLPALDRGDWVISDRFSDSTMVYQGYAGGVERRTIAAMHSLVLGDFLPDRTFVLDLDIDLGLARAAERLQEQGSGEDRFERKPPSFHQRIRDGFLAVAHEYPERCRVIDASVSADIVADNIYLSAAEAFGLEVT